MTAGVDEDDPLHVDIGVSGDRGFDDGADPAPTWYSCGVNGLEPIHDGADRMSADPDHVIEQLRLIRAENAKRDLEFALLRADFTAFRDIANTQLSAIVRMLGRQTDALRAINDQLLALRQEGEP